MSTLEENLYGSPEDNNPGLVPAQIEHLDRYPIVFLIDVSASTGVGADPDIGHINTALNALVEKLKHPSADSPLRHHNKQVDLCLIAYNDKPTLIQPWSLIDNIPSPLPALKAGGTTAMGKALKEAIRQIRKRHSDYRKQGISSGRCHIIHLSDGEATDMRPGDALWQEVTQEIYKVDGSADPENQKIAIFNFCSPRGLTTDGVNILKKMSGKQSVYALGTELDRFDTLVVLLSQLIALLSSAAPSDVAIEKAAEQTTIREVKGDGDDDLPPLPISETP
jgi:uncharacterized protein YegL